MSYVLCLILFLAACGNDKHQGDVVARVNDVPIFLEDIERGYDTHFFEWSNPLPPSVQKMKNAYGQVLLDLILIELIREELESRNLSVTAEEILQVENEIRKDYPENEFEKMLIEEYIDLHFWRSRIEHKLIWEKFVSRVLMADINVELQEIQDYYYSNIDDFQIPDRLVFLYLSSGDRQLLENTVKELNNFQSADRLKQQFSDAVIVKYEMRTDQLPNNLASDLLSLEKGQVSEIRGGENQEFFALYIVDRKQGQLLKPHQVYGIIEKELMEEKLSLKFNSWVAEAIEHSRIEINSVILDNL